MDANDYKKRWLAKDTDTVKDYKIRQKKYIKEWQDRNPEKMKVYLKKYNLANKEKVNERNRMRYHIKKLSKQNEGQSKNAD